ncbi:hypothetical protein DAKH74_017440 [Maudiozyma humilis]|uniref:PA14 domain-containing protein n=1 Tax=Maudiozyma humilis TaxID=51915 RepID=A0AAV5RUP4_MAUHU|nr:hypothetical protein DAKH74_017440 [Kazachstania humilis]
MSLAKIFVQLICTLISLNVPWAYADDGADAAGYPIVQIVTDRSGMMGISSANPIDDLDLLLANLETQTTYMVTLLTNNEGTGAEDYITKNGSFYVPITQGGAPEIGTILGRDVDISNMIAEVGGFFVPTETGSYTFDLDYTGTVLGFIIRDIGVDCVKEPSVNVDTYGNLYFAQDVAAGPEYTSSISHTLTLTAGQTYDIGYYYTSKVNTTFHNTQPAVSLNFTMTLPNGQVVTDFTDYITSGYDNSRAFFCQYNETDISLSTWSESYTSTYSTDIYTVTPGVSATGTDAITRVVESYYVLVPSSTSSSVLSSSSSEILSSTSTSSDFSSSTVISSSEIQSSSWESSHSSSPSSEFSTIITSLSASNDISSVDSAQEVSTIPPSVESTAISASQSSSPSLSVASLSSTRISSTTIISSVISSSNNAGYGVSINGTSINSISSTGQVVYPSTSSASLIPGTSSFPNRNVISTNASASSIAMTSSSDSTLSITSENYYTQSMSVPSVSVSSEHTTSELSSAGFIQLSSSSSATSAGAGQFRNVTSTSERSSSNVRTNDVTTQTYTDQNGATITTVVPCVSSESSSGIATSETSPATTEESVLLSNAPGTLTRVTTTLSSGGETTVKSGNAVMETDNNGVIATKIVTDCSTCALTASTKASHNTTPNEQVLSSSGIQQYGEDSTETFGTAIATSTPILYSPASGNGAVHATANIISLIICMVLFS